MLRRVLYVSTVAVGLLDRDVEDIVARSQRNNRRLDITSVLAVGRGVFAQVLEGSDEALDEVLLRINRDKRHHQMRVVLDEQRALRSFDRWSMRLLVDDPSACLAHDVVRGTAQPQDLLQLLQDRLREDPH